MAAEKVAAFYESWNAMWLEAYRAGLTWAFSPHSFWLAASPVRARRHARRTAAAILGRGLQPIHRRATVNVTRLARVRRRA